MTTRQNSTRLRIRSRWLDLDFISKRRGPRRLPRRHHGPPGWIVLVATMIPHFPSNSVIWLRGFGFS